MIRLR
jgi:hypothetical protein